MTLRISCFIFQGKFLEIAGAQGKCTLSPCSLGCYNRIPLCRTFHFTVLEAGKSKTKARDLSVVSFIKTPISFMRTPPSGPDQLPKAPPPNANTLGLGFQHMNWGETNSQSAARMCFCQLQANSLPCEVARFCSPISNVYECMFSLKMFSLIIKWISIQKA